MMGGKITVQSEVGRGSTFRFGARFGRSSRLAAARAQPPVVDLHGLRVLIVDDNATNRTILQGCPVLPNRPCKRDRIPNI